MGRHDAGLGLAATSSRAINDATKAVVSDALREERTGHMAKQQASSPGPGEELARAVDSKKPLDGSGNNPEQDGWGSAGSRLIRLSAPTDDGALHSVPRSRKRIPHWADGNPRTISNLVCREDADIKDPAGRTHWMWAWGQFVDHQLDLTGETEEVIDIEVDPTDPALDGAPNVIPFKRSTPAPGTGISYDEPREFTNLLSSFIDGSSVYGNDPERLGRLIDGAGPYLRTSGGTDIETHLLPRNTADDPADNADPADFGGPADFFLAGDVRVNEHVVLTSMHTIFVRLHNWKVAQIEAAEKKQPKAKRKTTEEVFQHARCWVAAVMQVITYCEFLPQLLGPEALTTDVPYHGFNPGVQTTISAEFSTCAYRLGHSMLPGSIPVPDQIEGEPRLTLEQAFFRPSLVEKHNVGAFVKALHTESMQQVDTRVTDGVRNFLFRFGPNGDDLGLLDLPSLNIMRGRDHRIAPYNDVREALGLPRVSSFGEICADPVTASRLQQAYGDVDAIDLWIGGLAEAPLTNAVVGETFHTILLDQFSRLRDGDQYYWENPEHPVLDADEQDDLRSWTIARVLTTVVSDLDGIEATDMLFNPHAKVTHVPAEDDDDGPTPRTGSGCPSYPA